MSFRNISFKMFKANISEYRLFAICNILAIAILYSFIAIVTNEEFMNPTIVNSMISHNIYAPTGILIIFNSIFMPYSQNIFMKSRQKDYGILLSMGLSEREMISSIFIDNLIMCIFSLIFGLALGTVLNLFFIWFIKYIICIEGINIVFSKTAYRMVFLYTVLIYIVSLIINIYRSIQTTVTEKLKVAIKVEGGKYYRMWFVYIGIILNLIAIFIFSTLYENDSNIFFVISALFILGSILLFFNGEALIEYFKNKHYKSYIKNIFFISDIKYYYGKNKKTFLSTTWILFTIMFFIMAGCIIMPGISKYYSNYNKFDISCFENEGEYKPIDFQEVKDICNAEGNSIEKYCKVNFVRNGAFTLFCVDDVNEILDENFNVDSGSYIYVYPYDPDGEKYGANSLDFISDEGERKFTMKEYIVNLLFGKLSGISDYILLVNKSDFDWINKSCRKQYFVHGILNLYNLKDWKTSENIVEEIENRSYEKNNMDKNNRLFAVSSKIKTYLTEKKSSDLLIFTSIYVGIFLLFTCLIIINFKLDMEYEEEAKKYFSLYRMGIVNSEIKDIINKKIFMLLCLPTIYSIILISIYGYFIDIKNNNIGFVIGVSIAIMLGIINYIIYKIYSMIYFKKFMCKVELL